MRVPDHAVERLVADLRSLPGLPAALADEFHYASLPLCILDAVFSINARYESVRAAVLRYATHFGLPVAHPRGVSPAPSEQATVDDLIARITAVGPERFASEVLRNRARTSSRGGILKAEASLRFAQVLGRHGIQVLQDLTDWRADPQLEADLRSVHGQGSGVAVRYFFMLAGATDLIKPDRMVIGYLSRVLQRHLGPTRRWL